MGAEGLGGGRLSQVQVPLTKPSLRHPPLPTAP